MLSHNIIFDLVSSVFDPDQMGEAVKAGILAMVDYEELADAVICEHEVQISEIIAGLAEDSLS